MQEEIHVALVRIAVKMVNALGVEKRAPPLDAVDFIAFIEKQFGEIGAVLSCHSGYQGFLF
jgi:hypothetical protein